MKIILEKCGISEDWYSIVRAEHDGREWYENNGNYTQYMLSKRLVPNACIEGNSYEMKELAKAIRSRTDLSFKRCAVKFVEGVVYLYSPKNSTAPGIVSIEEVDELAIQIEKEIV
jgi:hypothetical protein